MNFQVHKEVALKDSHVAWDYGAINEAFEQVLGFGVHQRSTKTLCNRRVSMFQIDNSLPTCPDCIREHNKMTKVAYSLCK